MAESYLYSYSRIRPNQLRLVRFVQDELQKQKQEVSAVLEIFSIEDPLPTFRALSYAWAAATPEDDGEESATTTILNRKAELAPKTWNIQIITGSGDGGNNTRGGSPVLPVLATLRPFVQVLMSKGVALQSHDRDDYNDDANFISSYGSQWWWIDSISIDQANLTERAQQVQLMRFMYLKAEQVVVWLGESSTDSDLAMDFIEALGQTMQQESITSEQVRAKYEIDAYRPQWTALKGFLSRRWWTRIWTIQEFVIPPTLLFWCGIREISRDTVCYALTAVDRCTTIGIKETRAFRYAYNRKRAWNLYEAAKAAATEKENNGTNPEARATRHGDGGGGGGGVSHNRGRSQPLLSLTAYFSCMDATDDRDRLYGLRALATDGDFLDVDYTLSVQEVYLRFAQAFIERHKSLDIICFATVHSAPSLLPSWVPDWHRRDAFLSMPVMASQSCSEHVGNLRPAWTSDYDASISFSASGNRPAVFEFQGSTLLAQGAIIDEIDGLAGSGSYPMTQSSTFIEPTHNRYSPIQILRSICKCLALDRNDRFLRYGMPANDEFFQDFLGLCAPLIDSTTTTTTTIGTQSQSIAKEIQEWFGVTKSLEIHGRSFETILRDGCRPENNPYDLTSLPPPNQDEYRADTFSGRFVDTVVRMALRLMFSRGGRIGMASDKARKGDLVCVLYGCSIPLLLRRQKSSSSSENDAKDENKEGGKEEFILVGECFVDGCMDGSALERQDIVERTFLIR
ncbi:hypothetical protein VTG60DRAFT_337 [Thermothelomyces hinnuleus]